MNWHPFCLSHRLNSFTVISMSTLMCLLMSTKKLTPVAASGTETVVYVLRTIGAPLALRGLIALICRDALASCTLHYNGISGEFTLAIQGRNILQISLLPFKVLPQGQLSACTLLITTLAVSTARWALLLRWGGDCRPRLGDCGTAVIVGRADSNSSRSWSAIIKTAQHSKPSTQDYHPTLFETGHPASTLNT